MASENSDDIESGRHHHSARRINAVARAAVRKHISIASGIIETSSVT